MIFAGSIALTGSKDRTCKVWNADTGECIRSLSHSSELNCVTMNSTVMLTGDEYSDVFVWDVAACTDSQVEDGSRKLLLRTMTGHNGPVHTVQCTPTGLVTCDVTGLVLVRDFWNCIQEGPGLRILRYHIVAGTVSGHFGKKKRSQKRKRVFSAHSTHRD